MLCVQWHLSLIVEQKQLVSLQKESILRSIRQRQKSMEKQYIPVLRTHIFPLSSSQRSSTQYPLTYKKKVILVTSHVCVTFPVMHYIWYDDSNINYCYWIFRFDKLFSISGQHTTILPSFMGRFGSIQDAAKHFVSVRFPVTKYIDDSNILLLTSQVR